MLFHSLHYLVFLPIVVAIYFWLPLAPRRIWLLLASFYFYCVFSIPLSLLLLYAVALNYVCARLIESAEHQGQRKLFLAISLIGNLGMLFTFKYLDLFSLGVNGLAGEAMLPVYNLILPMGISFYTFQTMSYTIDVYRRQIKAERNLLDVALYVSYFPQLVAGPIMRAGDLMPQFKEKHEINTARILSGFLLIAWGLSKKIFIADPMGNFVDPVYANPQDYSGQALLFATYAFAIQIFADFSAYTDIALGSARIMGFRLIENFNSPYTALSLREFWHRWHISLSNWLRDYLYIPLGGSRKGLSRTLANIMITMLLGGLWHGASWNFAIWGALHGVFLVIERLIGRHKKTIEERRFLSKFLGWFITFHCVCLAWVFFRAPDLSVAMDIISGVATWRGGETISLLPLVILSLVIGMQFIQNRMDIGAFMMRHSNLSRWFAYIAIILCIVAMLGGRSSEFIYFQF